jgi:hypothetical protein
VYVPIFFYYFLVDWEKGGAWNKESKSVMGSKAQQREALHFAEF